MQKIVLMIMKASNYSLNMQASGGWWVGFFNLQLVVGMLKVSKFRKLSEISLGAKKNYFGI